LIPALFCAQKDGAVTDAVPGKERGRMRNCEGGMKSIMSSSDPTVIIGREQWQCQDKLLIVNRLQHLHDNLARIVRRNIRHIPVCLMRQTISLIRHRAQHHKRQTISVTYKCD